MPTCYGRNRISRRCFVHAAVVTAAAAPLALLAGCSPTVGPGAAGTPTPSASAAPSGAGPTLATPSPTAVVAEEQVAYLDEALDFMQANFVHRDRVDWVAVRREAREWASAARRPEDTYFAIAVALSRLAEKRDAFLTPIQAQMRTKTDQDDAPVALRLAGAFGFVTVPATGAQGDAAVHYAANLQRLIRAVDGPEIEGWVIDLRGNHGGDMWPMLAGVGPILGDGPAGMFVVSPGAHRIPWAYRGGDAVLGDRTIVRVPGNPYRLLRPRPPVAVLLDADTGSSGEMIALSFRGWPDRAASVPPRRATRPCAAAWSCPTAPRSSSPPR